MKHETLCWVFNWKSSTVASNKESDEKIKYAFHNNGSVGGKGLSPWDGETWCAISQYFPMAYFAFRALMLLLIGCVRFLGCNIKEILWCDNVATNWFSILLLIIVIDVWQQSVLAFIFMHLDSQKEQNCALNDDGALIKRKVCIILLSSLFHIAQHYY